MTKSGTIRLLHAERCSVSEIAAATGYRTSTVTMLIQRLMPAPARIAAAFRNWRSA